MSVIILYKLTFSRIINHTGNIFIPTIAVILLWLFWNLSTCIEHNGCAGHHKNISLRDLMHHLYYKLKCYIHIGQGLYVFQLLNRWSDRFHYFKHSLNCHISNENHSSSQKSHFSSLHNASFISSKGICVSAGIYNTTGIHVVIFLLITCHLWWMACCKFR